MSARNAEKQKAKRKAKQKERRRTSASSVRKEQADFFFAEAEWNKNQGNFTKALEILRKALKRDPRKLEYLRELTRLGDRMQDNALQLEGLSRLWESGQLEDGLLPIWVDVLLRERLFDQALKMSTLLLERLPGMHVPKKKEMRARIGELQEHCRSQLQLQQARAPIKPAGGAAVRVPTMESSGKILSTAQPAATVSAEPPKAPALPASVPVTIFVDGESFQQALVAGVSATRQQYEMVLAGHRLRFRDSFENLICLSQLKNVRSFWYQEETARKVLKSFRGRALLSDEVGLGKTIEAAMVLKEYIQRGMVKSALILTPTPLVSQWKEELKIKFDLDFASTDDPEFRKNGLGFWGQPLVLASINQAKSARHFDAVAAREYDIVIVDEAHHLKNRATLNWKLVNALKKRFLLLLSATPVENNLMELYNLITLLKPGQLKTASAFREEFMTRGDPTSPRNRVRLKELLGQVMIRNTRALARLNIPPRFAQTIRVAPGVGEKELYARIDALVLELHRSDGSGHKMLLKNLLAEAGSSPRAVVLTLERVLARRELDGGHQARIGAIHDLARGLEATGKNKLVLKLIRSNPDKVIIFVKYLGTLEHLSDLLSSQKIPHAVFHGGLDNTAKDEQIQAFRDTKPVLVTTEVGGEGRNLQFCHRMINYDLPWNPMKIEQRIGRLHRIGQTSEVQIYNLCAEGSIEDYILEILDRKINMFEMVIGEIDMVLGRVQGEKDFSELVYDIWVQAPSSQARLEGFDALGTRLKRSKAQYESTRVLDEKLFGENYEL